MPPRQPVDHHDRDVRRAGRRQRERGSRRRRTGSVGREGSQEDLVGRIVELRALDEGADAFQTVLLLLLRLVRQVFGARGLPGHHGPPAETGHREHPGNGERDRELAPARALRQTLGGDLVDAGDDAVLEAGRAGLAERERERRGGSVQLAGLFAAGGAPRQVRGRAPARRRPAGRRARARSAGRERRGSSRRLLPSFARRTLISAVRRRVFTVPSGMPSASAISRAVRPRKYARDEQRRSASGERLERPDRGVALHDHGSPRRSARRLGHLVDEHERGPRHAGLAAEPVDGEVVRDRHQPRGQAPAGGVEPRSLPPRHEEDVLRELLGRLARFRAAASQACIPDVRTARRCARMATSLPARSPSTSCCSSRGRSGPSFRACTRSSLRYTRGGFRAAWRCRPLDYRPQSG